MISTTEEALEEYSSDFDINSSSVYRVTKRPDFGVFSKNLVLGPPFEFFSK